MINKRALSIVLLTMLFVVLVTGCGTDRSPVATGNQAEVVQAEDGRAFLAFSTAGVRRAARIATLPAEGVTVSGLIDLEGGTLSVDDANGGGTKDDVHIDFTVAAGALSAPQTITMTVYGNSLEELIVAFDPGGLVFLLDAELDIRMGKDLVSTSVEQIRAWHEYADGSGEDATITEAYSSGNTVRVKVAVPGFSRYSMGGGE